MDNQKKIDKASNKISLMYIDGITDIVDTLLKAKEGINNKDFATSLLSLDLKEIVKLKLSNINKEYVKAHIEVLKDIKPQVNNDRS
tara:strand:+ start:299 stop:556 length:258 start_codon:yes stop_codon:yes gene_type:complete